MPPEVIVYTTPTGKVCRAARSYLAEKGIAGTEIDLAHDSKAKYQVRKLSGRQRIPVFVIGGQVVSGFDRERLEEPLSD